MSAQRDGARRSPSAGGPTQTCQGARDGARRLPASPPAGPPGAAPPGGAPAGAAPPGAAPPSRTAPPGAQPGSSQGTAPPSTSRPPGAAPQPAPPASQRPPGPQPLNSSTPSAAAPPPPKAPDTPLVAAQLLPGSSVVLDRSSGRLVPCSADSSNCPHAQVEPVLLPAMPPPAPPPAAPQAPSTPAGAARRRRAQQQAGAYIQPDAQRPVARALVNRAPFSMFLLSDGMLCFNCSVITDTLNGDQLQVAVDSRGSSEARHVAPCSSTARGPDVARSPRPALHPSQLIINIASGMASGVPNSPFLLGRNRESRRKRPGATCASPTQASGTTPTSVCCAACAGDALLRQVLGPSAPPAWFDVAGLQARVVSNLPPNASLRSAGVSRSLNATMLRSILPGLLQVRRPRQRTARAAAVCVRHTAPCNCVACPHEWCAKHGVRRRGSTPTQPLHRRSP